MEYVHAAILLHKAGKPVNEENLTNVLTAAGITVDPIRVKGLVASLAEVNIDDALKSAATFTPVTTAPAATPAAAPATTDAKSAVEDKKKEQEKEEAAIEGLGALFG
jgi:large subunit ribosomal protein L12